MTTAAPSTISLPARPPLSWSRASRAATEARLRKLGTTITELSDARELAGRPRLSESTPEQRHYAPLWLLGKAGQGWLAKARELRALLTEALGSCDSDGVREARLLLGLRSAQPARWRLGELQAVYAQARALELVAEGGER